VIEVPGPSILRVEVRNGSPRGIALLVASAELGPVLRVAGAWQRLYVVPVRVVRTGILVPQLLAGHGAGLAVEALVEVEDHRNLALHASFC